jgi:hypothetical protein
MGKIELNVLKVSVSCIHKRERININQGILILRYYFINVDAWVANPV